MTVPVAAIAIIKEFEGLFLNVYPDPLSGGKPYTVGFGCTLKPDGSPWHLGESITEAQANEYLTTQLEKDYIPHLEKIPTWNKMNTNQKSALISFAYNLGASVYGSSNFQSITNLINTPSSWTDTNYVTSTFIKYRNPGSNVEVGLKRRREAEAKLFLTKV